MEKIVIKRTAPQKVAYIQHDGGNQSMGLLYTKLYDYADSTGVSVDGDPMGMFYDDPSQISTKGLIGEALLPVSEDAEPLDDVKVRTLPEDDVAVLKHRGPERELPSVYRRLIRWMASNGWEPKGPPREVYRSDVKGIEGSMLDVEIHVPVKKKS